MRRRSTRRRSTSRSANGCCSAAATSPHAIRSPTVSAQASVVAADPAVRAALVARQRELLASGDWVAEGRDIGTVVAPTAELKVFLDGKRGRAGGAARPRAGSRSRRGGAASCAPATPATAGAITRR